VFGDAMVLVITHFAAKGPELNSLPVNSQHRLFLFRDHEEAKVFLLEAISQNI
jgi:hypothetical protein